MSQTVLSIVIMAVLGALLSLAPERPVDRCSGCAGACGHKEDQGDHHAC